MNTKYTKTIIDKLQNYFEDATRIEASFSKWQMPKIKHKSPSRFEMVGGNQRKMTITIEVTQELAPILICEGEPSAAPK